MQARADHPPQLEQLEGWITAGSLSPGPRRHPLLLPGPRRPPDRQADEPSVVLAPRSAHHRGGDGRGNGHNVALTVDASVPQVQGGYCLPATRDEHAIGPAVDATWHVTGRGAGYLRSASLLLFTGVEALTGDAGNRDTCVFTPAGRLSGTVNGGADGFDTLGIQGGTHQRVVYSSSGPDAGTIDLDGTRINYAGLEPITDTSVTPDRVFTGTFGADQIVLESSPTPGMMTIRSANGTFESVTFLDPANSLTIKGDFDDDTVSIKSVDPAFQGALMVQGDDGNDTINVDGSLTLPGAALSLDAETVEVKAGITVSTRNTDASGNSIAYSGAITIKGRNITLDSGAKLLAGVEDGSPYLPGKVTLTAEDKVGAGVGVVQLVSPYFGSNLNATTTLTGATIEGGDIQIGSEAQTSLSAWEKAGDFIGLANELGSLFGQAASLGLSLLSPVSGQARVERATSSIVLTDATINGSGFVTIGAKSANTASVNALGVNSRGLQAAGAPALPFIVSVGYGQAETSATVTVAGQTRITAGSDVGITSESGSKADVKALVSANSASAPESDKVSYGVAVGIAYTNEISHVNVGPHAVVTSLLGGVAIDAKGDAKTASKASPVLYKDGDLSAAVAISVDIADVVSQVDGTVIAGADRPTSFDFQPSMAVDTSGNTITLNIPVGSKLTRGKQLVYHTGGNPAIGGLVDGTTYVVADVVDGPLSSDGKTITQTITLARGVSLDLDNAQVNPAATHELAQLMVVEFDSSKVSTNDSTIALTGLADGSIVTYLGPNAPITLDAAMVEFEPASTGDTIRQLDGTPWRALGFHAGQQIHLSGKLADASNAPNAGDFTIAALNGDTLVLQETNALQSETWSPGDKFQITTLPTTTALIGGLTQGADYRVKVVAGGIKLQQKVAGVYTDVALNDQGAGIQGLAYQQAVKPFSPSTAVDIDRDTIELPNHGFQTGDLVLYTVDPTLHHQLTVNAFNGPDPTPVFLATRQVYDAPIDGLTQAGLYRVVVVDANHIRLAATPQGASDAAVIDLTATGSGTQSFVDPDKPNGIQITASLEAENGAESTPAISDVAQEWTDIPGEALGNAAFLLDGFTMLKDQIASWRGAAGSKVGAQTNGIGTAVSNQTGNSSTPGFNSSASQLLGGGEQTWDVGVAIGVNYAGHVVRAIVGPTAVLQSKGDIEVSATITEATQLTTTSSTTHDAGLTTQSRGSDVSVALGLGIYKNTADAIVESGAKVDARDAIDVSAKVEYPLLVETGWDPFNIPENWKEDGLESVTSLLDGTLGYAGKVFNVWTNATGGGSKADVAIGGSFALTLPDNHAEAIVQTGALINQDTAFQTPEQTVTVEATTTMQTIAAGGDVALGLNLVGGKGAIEAWKDEKDVLGGFKSLFNPFGVAGKVGGRRPVDQHRPEQYDIAEIQGPPPGFRIIRRPELGDHVRYGPPARRHARRLPPRRGRAENRRAHRRANLLLRHADPTDQKAQPGRVARRRLRRQRDHPELLPRRRGRTTARAGRSRQGPAPGDDGGLQVTAKQDILEVAVARPAPSRRTWASRQRTVGSLTTVTRADIAWAWS